MSAKCFACQCDQERRAPSMSFIMGIAFVGSFNAEAMKDHLCKPHLTMLEREWVGALPAVKPDERR